MSGSNLMTATVRLRYEDGTFEIVEFQTTDDLELHGTALHKIGIEHAERRGKTFEGLEVIETIEEIDFVATPDVVSKLDQAPPKAWEFIAKMCMPRYMKDGSGGDINEEYADDFERLGKVRADRNYRAAALGLALRMFGPWLSRAGLASAVWRWLHG